MSETGFRSSLVPQAGDQRWVRTAGSALHLLHSLYGPFSKLYGIGRCSKVEDCRSGGASKRVSVSPPALTPPVCHQMAYESWREQVEEGEQTARRAEIGKVFLIDRGENIWALKGAVRQTWSGGLVPLASLCNVLVVSADVDFVTPLCSQVVYEGLVDDIFRIKCGGCESSCLVSVVPSSAKPSFQGT